MSARAAGISTALLTFFQERPGKIITVDMLLRAFPEYDRNQIHGNVYNLRKKEYGKSIEALQRGTWRYVESAAVAEKGAIEESASKMRAFEILKETDDYAIALGMSDGNVYKITLLG